MKRTLSLAIIILISCFQWGCNTFQAKNNKATLSKPLVVFLVRHAEKASQTRDPELSAQGAERALALARVLGDTGIEYIHSSDYIRTRKTAEPTAEKLGLVIQIYNPGELDVLASQLKEKGGTHLVVGHSNSTPSLVALLGGEPGMAINDADEYDRLYIVSRSESGSINSKLLRYGEPYEEDH